MSRLIRELRRLKVVLHYLQIQDVVGQIRTSADELVSCRHHRHASIRFATEDVSLGTLFECGGTYRVWLANGKTNSNMPTQGPISLDATYPVLKSTAAPRVVAEVLAHVLPEDGSTSLPSAPARLSLLGD